MSWLVLPHTWRMTTLRERDREVLKSIYSFGVIPVSLLQRLHFVSLQMTRRWLRTAELRGWIHRDRGPVRGGGRPEDIVSLGDRGARLLSVARRDFRNIGHQLLISEFRFELEMMKRSHSDLEVLLAESFVDSAFIPDLVFGLRSRSLHKTLLFFVEADRGTEPLSGRGTSIQEKVCTYADYFRCEGYKVLEKLWECRLIGFRVLFYCEQEGRAAAIKKQCRGRDFVWASCVDCISEKSLGGFAWRSGDRTEPRSILGRLAHG